ncbi:hypothetical protein HDU85_004153 [Gaertneriomyces sp. JEL0708]|nr:hypothetical protein HDU85_004153 [Gaertneriomyces sp. JEL0708]
MLQNTTLLSITAISAPVFALGLGVSLLRAKQGRGSGSKDDPTDPLTKLVRAHSNAAEYAGVLIPLILLVDARTSRLLPGSALRTVAEWSIVGAAVSRTMLVATLATCRSLNDGPVQRKIGAVGTYIFGAILSVIPLCL